MIKELEDSLCQLQYLVRLYEPLGQLIIQAETEETFT